MKYLDVLDNFQQKIENYIKDNGGNYSSLESVQDKTQSLDTLLDKINSEYQSQFNQLQEAQNSYTSVTGSKSQDLVKAQKKSTADYTRRIGELNNLKQKYNMNGTQSIDDILNQVKSADVTLNALNDYVNAYENLKSCAPQEIDLLLNANSKPGRKRAKAISVNYLQRQYNLTDEEAADLKYICTKDKIQSKQFEEYFKKGFAASDVKDFYDTFLNNKDVGLSRKQLEKFKLDQGFDYNQVNGICEARRKFTDSGRDIKLSRFETYADYLGDDFPVLIDMINSATPKDLDYIYDQIGNQRKPGMLKAMKELKKLYK